MSRIPPNTNGSQVIRWHSDYRRAIPFFRAACLVFSVVCLFGFSLIRKSYSEGTIAADGGEWVALVLGIAFGICGLYLLIETRSIIDPLQRKARRESVVFGRFVLFPRSFQFSDFKAVLIRCAVDSESNWDQLFIGLKRNDGRRLWIGYWNAPHKAHCEPAEQLAEQLSNWLGVPLQRS